MMQISHPVPMLLSFLTFIVLGAACSKSEPPAPTEAQRLARAREIHDRVLTIDTHDDIPFDFATETVDPGVHGDRQVDLPGMREGGLDAAFFIVFVGQTKRTKENYEKAKRDAMTKFNAIHRMAEEMYPDSIEIAYTPDDVERIHDTGKLVACIGIENGYVIGRDLSLLKKYYDLGGRYITLAHVGHNDICDSSLPREDLGDAEAEHNGVSEFGKKVIAEMNRLGIMVDVSHISKKSMMDAVKYSKAPVIASHSSTTALCDHPRNMDDEQLMALKANGGVIQVVAFDAYVKKVPEAKTAALDSLRQAMGVTGFEALRNMTDERRAEYDRARAALDERWPRATLEEFVNHIDHAVKLIGIDHVGVSSDFDGGGGVVGWNKASETFNVTRELVRRGYTEEEIAKLWGGNLLRVWREVARVASEMQAQAGA